MFRWSIAFVLMAMVASVYAFLGAAPSMAVAHVARISMLILLGMAGLSLLARLLRRRVEERMKEAGMSGEAGPEDLLRVLSRRGEKTQ